MKKSSQVKAIDKQKQFEETIYQQTEGEYEVLGVYHNRQIKIKMRHRFCQYEWEVLPRCFLQGTRCPNCANNRRKTTTFFKEEVREKTQGNYEVIGTYQNAHYPIQIRHIQCGHEWNVTPNQFLNGSRCPTCAAESRRRHRQKTQAQFEKEVHQLTDGTYQVAGTYQKSNLPLLMIHTSCGHEWMIRPAQFLNGVRCPRCSKTYRKNRKDVSK